MKNISNFHCGLGGFYRGLVKIDIYINIVNCFEGCASFFQSKKQTVKRVSLIVSSIGLQRKSSSWLKKLQAVFSCYKISL